MASTAAVTLSTSAYTALSSGNATVLVATDFPVRVAISSSLPSADTDDWFPVKGGESIHLQGLDTTDNVYAKPNGDIGSATSVQTLKVRVAKQ